ncbi:nucleotidyltransferase family protein [Marinobacter profundi]|nr:nucleotidyltransferase family protein [Marinobacter profundi]
MTTAERNPDGGGYPVLVMAAGASRRMGRPKALLRYGGGNLLDRALELAAVLGGPVTVVAGGHYPLVRFRTRRQPVRWLLAENWQQGLSASLQAGLASLGPGVRGCFVLLADQPALWEADLRLLGQHARAAPWHAVAADHAGRPGVPAYLPRSLWPAIMALDGDRGAAPVLARAGAERIEIRGASRDIDTPEDWQALLRDSGKHP